MSAVETLPAPSRERYQALLGEAAQIRGISLWKDAWRRLKKNWAAMGSLWFLCALGLLAFFTPLLPLQSPQHQISDAEHKYQPPSSEAVTLEYDDRERRRLEQGIELDKQELRRVEKEIGELHRRLDRLPPKPEGTKTAAKKKPATVETAAEKERGAIEKEKAAKEKEKEALKGQLEGKWLAHPLNRLWNNPGPLTWQLLKARIAVFGKWSVPSLCGRDELGRDVLARIFWGARVSIIVGLVATLVSLAIGVSYGAVSGYLGGIVDTVMMRIVDILYSIPFIFIVIFLITILSEDSIKARLARWGIDQIVIFYFVIGAIYWLTMARVVRGQIISLKHEQFVDAARTIGAGTPRIVFRHLIPNVLGIVIVYLTLTIPSVMLFEAFLSFLGLGVQPPDVSWGLLMSEGLKVITPLEIHWWLVVFPGVALALTLFALNFLGDGLRDALDPRMKNR
ncbi:MAG TPA: ABC transporter permease [Pirellulaceae bacterium]|nr:ABC transporter permease [Pirellulaceae bacterium]